MNNTLYLLEMGMNDKNIGTDIKNHRIRTLENIDIIYKGIKYNMFFEFIQCAHWHYRRENKRTGEPLKHPVYTVDVVDGLGIDTEYETLTEGGFKLSHRCSELEREFWAEHREYTRRNILEVINRYKVGRPYTDIKLVEETAAAIIRKVGGWRELDIINGDSYFSIGDTWNNEHKIVKCTKRVKKDFPPVMVAGSLRKCTGLVDDNYCEVDLITGKITG